MSPVIYHGTPLTPRAALEAIGTGRAICVSFFEPRDCEVAEAISPAIMFRQRRILILADRAQKGRGLAGNCRLAAVLRVARASDLHAWSLGSDAGCPRGPLPDQRQLVARMAVRSARRSSLAHGWAARSPRAPLREVRSRLPWLDRADRGLTRLPRAHARGRSRARECLAGASHAARYCGGASVSVRQCGQHFPCSEWMAI